MTSPATFTGAAIKGNKGDAGYTPVKGVDYFDGNPGTPGDASACWPVGSIYINMTATDPATLFGFGTWAAIGAGRVLIGQDTGDSDFDTLGETGGSKTNTPAGTVSRPTFTGSAVTSGTNSGSATKIGTSSASAAPTSHTHSVTAAGTVSQPTFTGSALSVVQPYLVVKLWQRTA